MASNRDYEHEKSTAPKSLSMSFDGSFWGMKPLSGVRSAGNSNDEKPDADSERLFDADAGASLFDPDAILKSSFNTIAERDCGDLVKRSSPDVTTSDTESSNLPGQLAPSSRYQNLEAQIPNIISQDSSATLINICPLRARMSSAKRN